MTCLDFQAVATQKFWAYVCAFDGITFELSAGQEPFVAASEVRYLSAPGSGWVTARNEADRVGRSQPGALFDPHPRQARRTHRQYFER